ncbi:hypothetical protein HK104_003580, partial [Borealophlyctis nickersoniae]
MRNVRAGNRITLAQLKEIASHTSVETQRSESASGGATSQLGQFDWNRIDQQSFEGASVRPSLPVFAHTAEHLYNTTSGGGEQTALSNMSLGLDVDMGTSKAGSQMNGSIETPLSAGSLSLATKDVATKGARRRGRGQNGWPNGTNSANGGVGTEVVTSGEGTKSASNVQSPADRNQAEPTSKGGKNGRKGTAATRRRSSGIRPRPDQEARGLAGVADAVVVPCSIDGPVIRQNVGAAAEDQNVLQLSNPGTPIQKPYKSGFSEEFGCLFGDWADDLDKIVDNFFAKNPAFDLAGLWLMVCFMDVLTPMPARVEWTGFCVLSLSSFIKSYKLSIKAFLGTCAAVALLDGWTYMVFRDMINSILPTIANTILYGQVIGAVRGCDMASIALLLAFLCGDICTKGPPANGWQVFAAIHSVGHGSFMTMKSMVAALVQYRNERLALFNPVHGELRAYPMPAPHGHSGSGGGGVHHGHKTLYPRIQRNFFNACRQRNALAAYSAATAATGPGSGMGGSGGSGGSGGGPGTHSSRTGEKSNTYYYSNHYETVGRFDLCVLQIFDESALLSWSLPQSLIVTLCSLSPQTPISHVQNHHVPTPFHSPAPRIVTAPPASSTNGSTPTLTAVLPPPALAFSGSSTNGAIALPTVNASQQLHLPPMPPQAGSTTLSSKDVSLQINGVPWDRSAVCMPEGTIAIKGLKPDCEYEVCMGIRGYWSLPLRLCTVEKIAKPAPFRASSSASNPDPTAQEPPSPEQLAEKLETHTALTSSLATEQESKKASQQTLKKLKRDLSRAISLLRSEIDTIRKSTHKDAQNETRLRQRCQFLQDYLRKGEQLQDDMKRQIAELQDERAKIVEESELVAKDLATARESVKRAERNASATARAHQKHLDALTATLTSLDSDLSAASRDLRSLEDSIRILREETMISVRSRVKDAAKRKQGAMDDVAASKQSQDHWVAGRRREVDGLSEVCEGARARNEAVRRTVEEERKFKER